MSKYLKEIERMYEVTGGVDGVYDDPLNEDMIIIASGGNIVSMPKIAYESIKKRPDLLNIKEPIRAIFNQVDNIKKDIWYRKFDKRKF